MSEIFDVVDENDSVIGKATRDECHKKGLIHRSVMFFIFDRNGKVFVNKRSDIKDFFPGMWSIAMGGHLNSGETYENAIKRELLEETGLKEQPFYIGYFKKRIPEERENVKVYGVITDKQPKLLKEEIVYGKFMTMEELEEKLKEEEFVPETETLYGILKEYKQSIK